MEAAATDARDRHKLEEVFRLSGVPTHTFVMPDRYAEIKVSVRTPGRCLVLEGPSGIGKTTTITKVIEDLKLNDRPVLLSARKPEDVEYILALPTIAAAGIVIVDDFHRLHEDAKRSLADYMKVLADTEERLTKLVLIGINKAGQQLINFGADVGLRIDIFKLEANSPDKILELIGKGEEALKVSVASKTDIAERSVGSFQIAQMLCHKLCVINSVTEEGMEVVHLRSSVDTIIETVMSELSRQYQNASILFARGPKMKSAGWAPYLHLLKWLSQTDDGTLDIRDAMRAHSDMKGSVGQVLDKDFLERHLESLPTKASNIESMLFFDKNSALIGAEDPKYLFYLRNLVWRSFGRKCGFAGDYFKGRYDFALSFAGLDRQIAEEIHVQLMDRDIAVFYDFAEQHEIAGANVEDYLAPIYRSEARYIVAILSAEYPKRIWTKFESDNFRDRFGEGSVIAIRFNNLAPGFFSDELKYGALNFDPSLEMKPQIEAIVDLLTKKIAQDREASVEAEKAESVDA